MKLPGLKLTPTWDARAAGGSFTSMPHHWPLQTLKQISSVNEILVLHTYICIYKHLITGLSNFLFCGVCLIRRKDIKH